MDDIFSEIVENRLNGRQFILTTIVETSGHSPRDAGAKMIVYPDGAISGTIGGGNFEKMVIDDCLKMFNDPSSCLLKHYLFEETGPDSTAMLCGGEARVFMESFAALDSLIIFGGGHICRALVSIASPLNFKITVVDNRPEILKEYQLPTNTIYAGTNYASNFPRFGKNCYVVIVTHGHKFDKEILAKVIREDCAYIGMIGSHKKIAQTFAALEKEGIDKTLLAKVHSPIGLDIGAEGPYEIAIAIAAELIAVQRHNPKK